MYRENMFLENPLVPERVCSSVSPPLNIFKGNEKYEEQYIQRKLSNYENLSVIVITIEDNLNIQFKQNTNKYIANSLKCLSA